MPLQVVDAHSATVPSALLFLATCPTGQDRSPPVAGKPAAHVCFDSLKQAKVLSLVALLVSSNSFPVGASEARHSVVAATAGVKAQGPFSSE